MEDNTSAEMPIYPVIDTQTKTEVPNLKLNVVESQIIEGDATVNLIHLN